MADRNPETVRQDLREKISSREGGSDALLNALKEEVRAKFDYESALIKFDVEIYHDAVAANDRIPGADNRKALAQAKVFKECPELYQAYLETQAKVVGIKARCKGLEHAIEGLRSELSSLMAEYRNA